MAATKAKVLKIAKAEVGYVEKKSKKSLDSKKANKGYNNYTKYNRDMKKIRKAGTITDYWCCNFVCWCFVMAYGAKKAKELLGGFTNYVPYLYNHFEKKGRVYRSPKVGDVVIFRNCSHVGIVYAVKNGCVYTYEGNTSSGAFNANGGGVSNLLIVNLTASETVTLSVWQNTGSSQTTSGGTRFRAVRIA